MRRYSIESRTRKYFVRYEFYAFARNLFNKYEKQILDTASKAGLNALKIIPKRVL